MAFLGLRVPPETARILSEINFGDYGEKEDAAGLHVTMLYLGKEVAIEKVAAMLPVLLPVASSTKPFTVSTSHVTTFPPNPDDGVPIIAKVDSNDLHTFRKAICMACDVGKIEYNKKYPDYRPHVTLGYSPDPAVNYANQGESQRLSLMMLLLDIEPRKSLWQANPAKVKSWDVLLQEEGLCTPTLFGDFKRAIKMNMDVKAFGVYASAAIVKVPAGYRTRVIQQTQGWISSHRIKPTYQRITKYVSERRKELGIRTSRTPMHQLRAENNRLKRKLAKAEDYINVLKASLRDNNVRIPREPT